ncbi:hypothetical protein DAI22_06g156906 [Oryza sativa Japonica Group]|uniref:Uncharacterized protein n=1 Tax=Oryza sativa subsp. japonica TaxID=39947 RepID=Q69TQ4_ORYSJ|nr:hypothetical protein DAI22_06g156906 [Oryza sativa Japonica Group]BAD35760.1 hypothetical protein [Oryza sativa Japonica Group]BAD35773.1 hypothetical protein [Oryza sativa Japonica Group]
MEAELHVVATRSIATAMGNWRQRDELPTMVPASSGNLDDGVHGQAAEAASTRRPIHSCTRKSSSMSMLTTRWSAMRLHRTRRSGVREDGIHWDLHCD